MGRVKGIGVRRKRSYLKRKSVKKSTSSSTTRNNLNNSIVGIMPQPNNVDNDPSYSSKDNARANEVDINFDDSPYRCTRSKCNVRQSSTRRSHLFSPAKRANAKSVPMYSSKEDSKIDSDVSSCSSNDSFTRSLSPNKLKTPENGNTNCVVNDKSTSLRNIVVRNSINYNEKCRSENSPRHYTNQKSRSGKVLIRNTINCRRDISFPSSRRENDPDEVADSNVLITNTINYNEKSFNTHNISHSPSNVQDSNKKNDLTEYVQRRRAVGDLKSIVKKYGAFNRQVDLLTTFLNESDMSPILDAANILSPRTILLHKHLVDQIIKIVSRCSAKESCRGRVSNDQATFRTNLVAAIVSSPNIDPRDCPIKKNHLLEMLSTNTNLSKSSCRRLIEKAGKRRTALSVQETVSSWSVITHRHGYDTKQSRLNVELLEWILNHHHVIRSPDQTVSIRVPLPNGTTVVQRVAKLWLEISVRELHEDLKKEPPIGFSGAYCKDDPKKLIISERYLRNILPPQLRTMSFSDKQLCGCACCTITKLVHECLLKFRFKILSRAVSSASVATRKDVNNKLSLDQYRSQVMKKDGHIYPHPRDVLPAITCKYVSEFNLPKWSCVMGRCDMCPDIVLPEFESDPNNNHDISFGDYRYILKCKVHGVLEADASECQKCVQNVQKGTMDREERMSRRKEITLLTTSIYDFHQKVYIPYMKRYKYHMALVSLLSKNHCKKMRSNAFRQHRSWFLTEMDYAERLAKQLNGEIQSDHFGDNATLSIEGCTLQYHTVVNSDSGNLNNSSINLDFHSHFADYSRQDAATTFDHMNAMFRNHVERHGVNGLLPKQCVMLDHTDGCAKQYRSANALYLLNVFSMSHQIIVDRAICAPGHGKSIIDGLNAVDKHYLKRVMLMSGSNSNDDNESRMKLDSTLSFAKECARLCSLVKRKDGVLCGKLSQRFYHVHSFHELTYPSLCKATVGWDKRSNEKGNGILHHYNLRADPKLGYGYVAVRRIPCACDACVCQLKEPWISNKAFYEQPRYMSNNRHCLLWTVLGELNNWKLISIIDSKPSSTKLSSNVTRNIFKRTLQNRAQAMASLIVEGNLGAIATSDVKARSGYYVFKFLSCPYVLQEKLFNGSETISASELVCDISWYFQVHESSVMYYPSDENDISQHTTIRVQHVIDENLRYNNLTHQKSLPKQMRSQFSPLKNKNTIILTNECHDNIIQTIEERNHMDYEEDLEFEESHQNFEYDSDEDVIL